MCIIEQGKVEVFKNDVLVNRCGRGEIFGELSFVYSMTLLI